MQERGGVGHDVCSFIISLVNWIIGKLSVSLSPSLIHRNQIITTKCTWSGKGRMNTVYLKSSAYIINCVVTYPFSPFRKRMDFRTKYPHLKNTLTNVQINWLHDRNYPENKSTTLSAMLTSYMLILLFRDL